MGINVASADPKREQSKDHLCRTVVVFPARLGLIVLLPGMRIIVE
jgi:hypothetical protein